MSKKKKSLEEIIGLGKEFLNIVLEIMIILARADRRGKKITVVFLPDKGEKGLALHSGKGRSRQLSASEKRDIEKILKKTK